MIQNIEHWALRASSPSLVRLKALIISKMYWAVAEFKETGKDVYSVSNANGLLNNYRVIRRGNRYRLETK